MAYDRLVKKFSNIAENTRRQGRQQEKNKVTVDRQSERTD